MTTSSDKSGGGSPETSFGLRAIGQIAVPVSDIDRSVAFYRDVLGMHLLFQVPPGLGFFDCDGLRLMLDSTSKEFSGTGSVIYFRVDDIDSVHALLADRDVEFDATPHLVAKMPNHDLWMAFLRDPDENLIGLMSEVPR